MVKIVSIPGIGAENPYLKLFYNALKPHHITVHHNFELTNTWLTQHHGDIDGIHFHWPEECWRYAEKSPLGLLRGLVGFFSFVLAAKRYGIKIFWTVHNLEHHEGVLGPERLGYFFLAKQADILISHSEYAKYEIQRRWNPRGKILVMCHGNYDGEYPEPVSKTCVFSGLGLDVEIPTVCCIGYMRNYKGLDTAVKAANHLGPDKLQLIIAGKPHPEFDVHALEDAARHNNGIRILPKRLSAQEFSNIVSACDAVLLPYKKITGSGALMAAITLKTGVIMSDLPFFREVLTQRKTIGSLFKAGDHLSLSAAIDAFLSTPHHLRHDGIDRFARACAWEKVVLPIAQEINRRSTGD